jgi:glycine betaine/proline transport system substrate-binding protein
MAHDGRRVDRLGQSAVRQEPLDEVGDVLSDGGVDGWWIPDYLAEAHPELKTLGGILANPKLVGGRFNNCPVGWGCRTSNDNLIKAFELEKHGIQIFNHGSGEVLAASIASAYTAKEPWFGYYWAPTAVLGKYKMVDVDMGPVDKDKAKCNATANCPTPGKTGWPKATVLTAMRHAGPPAQAGPPATAAIRQKHAS